MNDYKKVRKALGDLVAHAYECDACYEDRCDSDCECSCHEHKHVAMTKARQMLAEIPETSEMERLVEWLVEHKLDDLHELDDYATGQNVFVKYILDYIRAEFDYGEEQDAAE